METKKPVYLDRDEAAFLTRLVRENGGYAGLVERLEKCGEAATPTLYFGPLALLQSFAKTRNADALFQPGVAVAMRGETGCLSIAGHSIYQVFNVAGEGGHLAAWDDLRALLKRVEAEGRLVWLNEHPRQEAALRVLRALALPVATVQEIRQEPQFDRLVKRGAEATEVLTPYGVRVVYKGEPL